MEIQPGIREDITLRSRKDNYMISEYREIENEYINIFSAHENCSGYERFYDDKFLVHPGVIVMSTNPWITIWRHRHYHAEEHD